jgi:hypothetical protein
VSRCKQSNLRFLALIVGKFILPIAEVFHSYTVNYSLKFKH